MRAKAFRSGYSLFIRAGKAQTVFGVRISSPVNTGAMGVCGSHT